MKRLSVLGLFKLPLGIAVLIFSVSLLGGCSKLASMPDDVIDKPHYVNEEMEIVEIQASIKPQKLSEEDYIVVQDLSDKSIELSLCFQKLTVYIGGEKSFASNEETSKGVAVLMEDATDAIATIRKTTLPSTLSECYRRLYKPALADFEYVARELPSACKTRDYLKIQECLMHLDTAGTYFAAAGELFEAWAPSQINDVGSLLELEENR